MRIEMRAWLGDEWPNTGEQLDDCDDEVAAGLIAAGYAIEVPQSQSQPEPQVEVEVVMDTSVKASVSGSVKDVISWVDGDRDRAADALAAEQARPAPRSSLVAQLGQIIEVD